MNILFVGSNPSVKNTDVNVAFHGTKSKVILDTWVKYLELNNYKVINIFDSPTPNNRPLTKREIKSCLVDFKNKLKDVEYDKIIALGNSASLALTMLKINHYKLPHPSPKNRTLNSKDLVDQKLKECKIFIYEHSGK